MCITGRLKPAECVKGVRFTRDGFGDFGGSGFDAAAVDGHDRDAGLPVTHPDAVVDTDSLMGLQFGKIFVSFHCGIPPEKVRSPFISLRIKNYAR